MATLGQLARVGLGAAGGAYIGREVTPQLFGYEHNPAAVNMSMLLDSALMAGLAGMSRGTWGRFLQRPTAIPELTAMVGLSEMTPVGMHLLTRGTGALERAQHTLARPPPPTVSEQLQSFLGGPTARGAAVGASGAALAGLLTGLLRARRPLACVIL